MVHSRLSDQVAKGMSAGRVTSWGSACRRKICRQLPLGLHVRQAAGLVPG